MQKRVIVDIHNHPDWLGYNLKKFLVNMKQYSIDKTWLLSWECPETEYDPSYHSVIPTTEKEGPIPFSRCLAYAEQAPKKFVLGYAPDPRQPAAADRLLAAVEIYGVRVYGELKLRMTYDNPDALRIFRFCGEKKLPVIVHIDYEFATGAKYPRTNWWYGVHTFEMLERAMGRGADGVFVKKDSAGITIIVKYPDNRRGIVELTYDAFVYGGCLRNKETAAPFLVDMTRAYADLLFEAAKFFKTGKTPVAIEDTLEIMDLLDASDRSNESGRDEPVNKTDRF